MLPFSCILLLLLISAATTLAFPTADQAAVGSKNEAASQIEKQIFPLKYDFLPENAPSSPVYKYWLFAQINDRHNYDISKLQIIKEKLWNSYRITINVDSKKQYAVYSANGARGANIQLQPMLVESHYPLLGNETFEFFGFRKPSKVPEGVIECIGMFPPTNYLTAVTILNYNTESLDIKDVEFSQVFCTLYVLHEKEYDFFRDIQLNVTLRNAVTQQVYVQKVHLDRLGLYSSETNYDYRQTFALNVKKGFTLEKVTHNLTSKAVPKRIFLQNLSTLPVFQTYELPL